MSGSCDRKAVSAGTDVPAPHLLEVGTFGCGSKSQNRKHPWFVEPGLQSRRQSGEWRENSGIRIGNVPWRCGVCRGAGRAGGPCGSGAEGSRPPRGRPGGRQAVHVLHLADHAEKARAVSDPHREGDAGDPRVSARAPGWRARGSPASCGSLVQLRRRERHRFLEQLRRDPRGRQAQDGHGSPSWHHDCERGRRSRRARHELRLGDA